jgi:lipopolysaccharide export system permease protein
LSAVSFLTNDLLLPASTIQFNNVYRRILYSNPDLELEPFSVKRFQDTSIVTGALQDGALHDVTIIDRASANERRVITAATARLQESNEQAGVISLTLGDVFMQTTSEGEPGSFEYARSDEMVYNIVLQDITVALASLGPREKSSVDVWREIGVQRADLDAQLRRVAGAQAAGAYALAAQLEADRLRLATGAPADLARGLAAARADLVQQLAEARRQTERPPSDRTLRNHLFEFHKKFSVPLACLVFVFFAFPAGLLAPRSGRPYGLLLGLGVAVLYWVMLFFGQTTGLRLRSPPGLTMWLPNLVVLAAAGAALFVRRTR